jgi:hypothetical protein
LKKTIEGITKKILVFRKAADLFWQPFIFAENLKNGQYVVVIQNVFDWCTRSEAAR